MLWKVQLKVRKKFAWSLNMNCKIRNFFAQLFLWPYRTQTWQNFGKKYFKTWVYARPKVKKNSKQTLLFKRFLQTERWSSWQPHRIYFAQILENICISYEKKIFGHFCFLKMFLWMCWMLLWQLWWVWFSKIRRKYIQSRTELINQKNSFKVCPRT